MGPLRELQRAFRRALLEGEEGGIVALVAADGVAPADRLAVYRNNLLIALTALLKGVYPAVCRLVGESFFEHAARAFVQAVPPTRPCLADYGGRFPDFLAAFPSCRELVYLPDIARLEWLMHAAAQAPETPPLAPQAFQAIAPEDSPRLVLRLHPSLGLVASPWPIERIWRANRRGAEGDPAVDLEAGGVRLAVRRTSEDVVMRAVPAAGFAFLEALHAGRRLDSATTAAFAEDAAFDLTAAFANLFRDGLVVGFALDPPARAEAAAP